MDGLSFDRDGQISQIIMSSLYDGVPYGPEDDGEDKEDGFVDPDDTGEDLSNLLFVPHITNTK